MSQSSFRFQLADAAWDQRLEQVAAEPVPGTIQVAYEHRPGFLASLSVLGDDCQVVVGHHGGNVDGLGMRSTRRQYLDGEPRRLGYLGGLRVRPSARSTICLARGYAFLRQLHEQDPVPGYLTTVIASNTAARAILESGRAGLPAYRDCGAYTTYVLAGKNAPLPPGIRPAGPADTAAVFALLREAGRRRQGFPVLAPEELGTPRLRGLEITDFLLVERDGNLLGCLAGWDQTGFRQHRIAAYAGALRWLRPLVNPWLALRGYPRLPPPGTALATLQAALLAVPDDNPQTAADLIRGLRARAAREKRHHLCLGLHGRDPLAAALRRFPAIRYEARLYAVAWDEPDRFARHFQPPHIPYLELGML